MAAFKNTKQRGAIMDVLKRSADPVGAEEIFAALKDGYPNLALSTVYRNLERFAEQGLINRDVFNDGVVRYSLAMEHHGHYLVCTKCANKIKIDDCPLTCLEQGLARDTGYEIEGHTLTIYGKCPDCLRSEQVRKQK